MPPGIYAREGHELVAFFVAAPNLPHFASNPCCERSTNVRVLTKKAEACCLGYRGKFGETGVVPVGTLVADIAMTMQEYTQMGGVRPFGVALLVAGLDLNGLKLFRLDSAGSYSAWKAVAIGKGSAEAEVILHQNFKDSMTREGALELVLDVVERCCSGTRREDVETAFIEIPSCRDPQ